MTGARGERSTITYWYRFRSSSKSRLSSALSRTVGGSGGPACGTAGRNASCVAGSFQITSSSDALPNATSTMPRFAPGAIARVSVGFRMSQSTRITETPLLANICATEMATVDFPLVRDRGRQSDHPVLLRPVIHVDRQLDRPHAFRVMRKRVVDHRPSNPTVSAPERPRAGVGLRLPGAQLRFAALPDFRKQADARDPQPRLHRFAGQKTRPPSNSRSTAMPAPSMSPAMGKKAAT